MLAAMRAWVVLSVSMLAAAVAAAAPPAAAPVVPAGAPATFDAQKAALRRASDAVVGVEATAVEDARSIATLGRSRQGSGVVIDDDGVVLTIGYLILEADHVDLVLDDGRRVPARVVAYDLATGFGLLQSLAPLGLVPAPLGASAQVGAEEPLLVASGGDDGALGVARMVSRRSFSGYWEYHIEGALFTAPARTDHSGAGLFNARGELVGIGSLVVADAAGPDAPDVRGNMFVPVDLLKPILPELRAAGLSRASRRPWLGINCVEDGGRVRVVRLTQESPAEAAGLMPGDAIVAVDGTEIGDLDAFYRTLWRDDRADRDVVLDVRRGDATISVHVHAIDRMTTLSRPQGV